MPGDMCSVLYGPSIEFRSEEWVKCSLLLWDSIYRIVPTSCVPRDSAAIKLAQDSGLIHAVVLEREDLRSTSSEFLEFVEELPFEPAGLVSGVERIHKEKVDERLYPLLEEMAVRIDPEGWLSLPVELARCYMLYLAKAVSSRRNLATATDNVDEWAIMPYFKEGGNFDEYFHNPEAETFYSFMMFGDVLPAHIASVDMQRVIDFSASRKDERARLRRVLRQFSESIVNCESPSHAAHLAAVYEGEIKQAKRDFAKSMDFYTPDQGYSLLTVGLPLTLAAFEAFGGNDPFSLLNVGTSVCIGAIAAYWHHSKVQRRNRKESYASYLVEIDRSLASSRVNYADRILNEFIND